jgi:hypothetical protein
MQHDWQRGATTDTPDGPPEGYSYCGNCGAEETDENRDGECSPEMMDFHQAVFQDKTMTPDQRLYWLKVCADDYLAKMRGAERAVSILRGAMGVLQGCAKDRPENLASDVPLVCGVALRATAPKLGVDVHKAKAAEGDAQQASTP